MPDETPPALFNSFMLDSSDGHRLYVEESGNPDGLPLVTFHGGPGSFTKPKHRGYYDLNAFRLIMFDQRGCGQSQPLAAADRHALQAVSPQAIVADAEAIRRHLGLDSWHVAGASWGSAMALLYAVTYPAAVRSLTLRALFLAQDGDWHWLAEGAYWFVPAAHAACAALFPGCPREGLLQAAAERILGGSDSEALETTKALLGMEYGLELLTPQTDEPPPPPKPDDNLLNTGLLYAQMIRNHRLPDGWGCTAAAAAALAGKPFTIIHGAVDIGCRIRNAYELLAAHPHARLLVAPNAGHGVDLNGGGDRLYKAALAALAGG